MKNKPQNDLDTPNKQEIAEMLASAKATIARLQDPPKPKALTTAQRQGFPTGSPVEVVKHIKHNLIPIIGSKGTTVQTDTRYIWVKFAKPLEDVDTTFYPENPDEPDHERNFITLGFRPDEIKIIPTSP